MLLNWQGRHFMEINHSRITSYEIADYMIRTKSLLSAKELAAILEKEYPHLDVDKRDVYGVSLDIENYCTLSSFFIISGFFGNVIFWMLRRSCGDIEHR
ncbi:hypothetical protein BT08F36_39360 [Escherichia coli]